MSLAVWVTLYVVVVAISVWMLWGRNAEKYSGSGFLVFLLRDFSAADESPGCLRAGAWLALIAATIIFIYGLYHPEDRAFWDLF